MESSIRSFIGVAGMILAAASVGCSGGNEKDLVASARTYLEAGDLSAAGIQAKAAIQADARSSAARMLLGQVLMQGGDAQAAAVEFGKARDLGAADEVAVPPLAEAMVEARQFRAVVDQFSRFELADKRADASLRASVALAYASLGDVERARFQLDKALQADPQLPRARLLEARLQAAGGDVAGAASAVDRLLSEHPRLIEGWRLKGDLALHGRDDPAAARDSYRKALEIDKRDIDAHVGAVGAAMRGGDLEVVRAQIEAMRAALPQHPETVFYEAQYALLKQDYPKVREKAGALLKIAPDNARVLTVAALAEYQLGSQIRAESLLGKALSIAPNNPMARRMMGRIYLARGQSARALAVVEPLLEAGKVDPEALAIAAEAALQRGDLSTAETLFQRAARAKPEDVRLRSAVALTRVARGDANSGLTELERLSTSDAGVVADMALISTRMRRAEWPQALAAVAAMERKAPDRAIAPFLRGRIELLRNDAEASEKAFREALRRQPTYFPAAVGLAGVLVATNRAVEGRQVYEALVSADPENHQALLALAQLQPASPEGAQARLDLVQRAIRVTPSDPQARAALIELRLARGDVPGAMLAAREALAALPDDLVVLDAAGRTQLAAGEWNQAIVTFRKLVSLAPGLVNAHLRLADAYTLGKDLEAAVASLRKAVEVDPTAIIAHRALISLAIARGRPQDAIAAARFVQEKFPRAPEGFMFEGDVHVAAKAWPDALQAYRKAAERGTSPELAVKQHRVLVSAGQKLEAARFAETWTRTNPRDAAFLFSLGSLALEAEQYEEAERRFLAVVALKPEDAAALNNIAWLKVKLGKGGALPFAEKANALWQNRPALMDTLALAYAADGQIAKAIETQRKAIGLDARNADLKLGLAKLYLAAGDKAAARAELEALRAIGAAFPKQDEVSRLLASLT